MVIIINNQVLTNEVVIKPLFSDWLKCMDLNTEELLFQTKIVPARVSSFLIADIEQTLCQHEPVLYHWREEKDLIIWSG